MARMKWFDWILITLLVIGGINWGIFGLGLIFGGYSSNWSLIHLLMYRGLELGVDIGAYYWIGVGLYLLIGFSALLSIFSLIRLAMKGGR